MLTMVDLGIGNLQSVKLAFERVGAKVEITTDARVVRAASIVVLPGVGAFGDGMAALKRLGLVEVLREHAQRKKRPLFGICVGMQLLSENSEEHGKHEGLGILPGRVVRLQATQSGYRVPNMGWCDLAKARPSALFANVAQGESFYFAHSYHLVASDPVDVAATFEYSGGRVVAAVERDYVFGVQFHPEKSQHVGLNLLEAFCKRVAA